MITFGALCHLVGPEKQTGMLCKKETDSEKRKNEEIEMELVSILVNTSVTYENTDD